MKKFLFDLFPLILFFLAYRYTEIYTATAVAIGASVLQILWLKLTGKAIETTHWINLSVIVIFGGATLWLKSDVFIKWKPTVLYWAFAAILLFSQVLFKKNLIRAMMEKQMSLPDGIWHRVNLSWVAFFMTMGLLNLYVAFNFSTAAWVNFKLFGGMGLMFAFIIVQSLILSKHMKEPQ